MTRKRYVKILMCLGIDRNIANKNAEAIQSIGWSYRRFYDEVMTPVLEN